MAMYNFLVHAHSGFRWILLVLLVGAIITAAQGLSGNRAFSQGLRKWALFAMAATHLQIVLGLALYFMSPNVQFGAGMMSNSMLRFFTVEHLTTMVIAAVLITVGYSRAKRHSVDGRKYKALFWFYLVGLILIIAGIPWPFRGFGNGWF